MWSKAAWLCMGVALAGVQARGASRVRPAVFWASDPVRPGEAVVVQGGAWGNDPRVELSRLEDADPGKPAPGAAAQAGQTAVVTPLESNAHALKFLVPTSWKPGVYRFQVNAKGAKSAPVAVNAPQAWWPQGDWGKEASPGGWLRVLGKCLSSEGKASVVLRRGGKDTVLKPKKQDCWSLHVDLPGDLQAGQYQIYVHNGHGGPSAWRSAGTVRIAPHAPIWKSKEFSIRDFGALPNDFMEDAAGIQAALDAAGANGGGIVVVPSGRYQVNRTLTIPRFVLLKGEAPELSMIYWRDRMDALPALVQATNSFGIQDLTFHATNHREGIVSDAYDKPDAGNIILNRVHLRMNRYVQIHPSKDFMEIVQQRTGGWLHGLNLGGENVQVTDCEVYSSTSAFAIVGRHTLVRNNRFFSGRWNSFVVGRREVIFEDNLVRGMDNQTWGGAIGVTQHLYYARNEFGPGYGGDREQFTTDGGGVAYVGAVASTNGVNMTLADKALWSFHHGWDWLKYNAGVFIMQGTGAGQLRRIVKYQDRRLVVDRPWDIAPDATSVVHVSKRHSHYLLIDNQFTGGTVAQLYSAPDHGILSGNRSTRCGGFHAMSLSALACWRIQFLGNRIVEGGGFNGPWNEQPPVDSHLAFHDKGGWWPEGRQRVKSPNVRGCVMRRNVLDNQARIETTGNVRDTLIENCVVRNADIGISIGAGAAGTVLLGNRFEQVKRPLVGRLDHVVFQPAQRTIAMLSGRDLVPAELAGSDAWRKAWRQMTALAKESPTTPDLGARVGRCHTDLVKAAAAHAGTPYSLDFVRALCGLTILYASHPLQAPLRTGSGGSGGLLIMIKQTAGCPPVSVTLDFPPPTGWTIAPANGLKPTPGGKLANKHVAVTIPRGIWGKPTIPVVCTVRGDGWRLTGTGTARLALGPTDYITEWMIVGPFEADVRAKLGDKVYPPHRRLDLAMSYPGIKGPVRWQPVTLTGRNVRLDFTTYFGKLEKGVAFAVAALRVKKPTPVAITFNPTYPTLACYLNGEKLGVPFRYGNRNVTRVLPAGENVLLTAAANSHGNWSQHVQVEVIESADPGDVQVVPASELATVRALRPAPLPPTPQGAGLPQSLGLDWRLVYQDRFNRNWLGTDWRVVEGKWAIEDGALAGGGHWGYLAYARKLGAPLRVEADIHPLADRRRGWTLAFCLTPAKEIADRHLWPPNRGAGYMLALDWHNRKSNELWRREQEVQVSTKGPFLQAGKKHHVIVQFARPRLMLVVDGKVSLDHTDKDWLPDLDTFSLLAAWSRDRIDNVRIYQAAPAPK